MTGSVTYDDDSKTLKLKNATISSTEENETNTIKGYGIYSDIDGLTIKIEGDNTITSEQWSGILSRRNLTITGQGTLNVNAKVNAVAMGNYGNSLNIAGGAVVKAKGMYGISGGTETRTVGGEELVYSYVTTLKVSGAKTELHAYGTEQCVSTIPFLDLDDGMEIKDENGNEAYANGNAICFRERRTGRWVYYPYANQWVTIKNPKDILPGDVNTDGNVSMEDANAVVNYFLATDKEGITNFNAEAANVNGDEGITMADANLIVNMFLGGQ